MDTSIRRLLTPLALGLGLALSMLASVGLDRVSRADRSLVPADQASPIVAPDRVTISGPGTVTITSPALVTAWLSPITATMPITYVWEATAQTAVIHADRFALTDTASFLWERAGPVAVTVTAANAGGIVVDTYALLVQYGLYLPVVVRSR